MIEILFTGPLYSSQITQVSFPLFSGYAHSTLYLNNIERGPAGEDNTILDYSDLSQEEGHTWIVGCSSGKSLGGMS